MDGSVVLGPAPLLTDATGYARYFATELMAPTPGAGSHAFQVQASTSSASPLACTARAFNLIDLQ
jgi:hypothetical protein